MGVGWGAWVDGGQPEEAVAKWGEPATVDELGKVS